QGGGQSGQRGQSQSDQGPGGQKPSFPIIDALDTNKNHVIDADEIANATANLKKLDKNGDGKLTPDEYMPKRPSGSGSSGGSEQRGQGGPGGAQGGQTQGQPPRR
ncbi:MAG: hypothetical protein JWM68_2838, partial [Verrucomicrobiales bacterium]|nr:hypothetical protein [Verrucomicrobiales bacterium]